MILSARNGFIFVIFLCLFVLKTVSRWWPVHNSDLALHTVVIILMLSRDHSVSGTLLRCVKIFRHHVNGQPFKVHIKLPPCFITQNIKLVSSTIFSSLSFSNDIQYFTNLKSCLYTYCSLYAWLLAYRDQWRLDSSIQRIAKSSLIWSVK